MGFLTRTAVRIARLLLPEASDYSREQYMSKRISRLFWLDIVLGSVSTLSMALTVAFPTWIERTFSVFPDGGDGSTEWGLAAGLAALSVAFFYHAHRESLPIAGREEATR